ncbi:hypothetical protein ADL01_26045 [Streptomyces sp. NRRL WC-3618]|nr:hypothetical protein ADL01_26045 [Streptomyces sp. NRRL WC-3618]
MIAPPFWASAREAAVGLPTPSRGGVGIGIGAGLGPFGGFRARTDHTAGQAAMHDSRSRKRSEAVTGLLTAVA